MQGTQDKLKIHGAAAKKPFFLSILFLFIIAFAGTICARAQATFTGSQVGLADGTWTAPSSTAEDGKVNVFVADRGNNRIVELSPASNWFAAPVTILTGLSNHGGVAADFKGNVFVWVKGNNRVLRLSLA